MASQHSFAPDILAVEGVTGGAPFSLLASNYANVFAKLADDRPADRVEVITSSATIITNTFTHRDGFSEALPVVSGAPLDLVSHPYTALSASNAVASFRLTWFRRASDR